MNLKHIITIIASLLFIPSFSSCSRGRAYSGMETELHAFIKDKDAQIGIAVIVDGRDTIAINGDKPFPMMSVYKFPIAIGVGEYCRLQNCDFSDSIVIAPTQLHLDTWSPMREVYGHSDTISLTIRQLLGYAIQQSDNNASDILLDMVGGARYVNDQISRDVNGIEIKWTEDEMHRDITRGYGNTSTPIAMARLLDRFLVGHNDPLSLEIKTMMEKCQTGKDRLAQPFDGHPLVTIGHKTGTGDVKSDGRIIAVNDVGYVIMPDGNHYVIAVFIKDSAYDMSGTSSLIASISTIVYKHLADEAR